MSANQLQPVARTLDLDEIPWDAVPRYPLPEAAVRTLRYMQDIESHTLIYLRTLLGTRAVDDPEVARFLATWFYEETGHGIALGRFLAAAGAPVTPRPRSALGVGERIRARATALLARAWPDFVAVHMTWGAINELTTLVGYQRLAAVARHPVLDALLARITRDESRHSGSTSSRRGGASPVPAWRAPSGGSSTGSGRPSAAGSNRRARRARSPRTSCRDATAWPPWTGSTTRSAVSRASRTRAHSCAGWPERWLRSFRWGRCS